MSSVMFWVFVVCLIISGVCALLGFGIYPAMRAKQTGDGQAGGHPKTKKSKAKNKVKRDDPLLVKQGMSRAMFAVFLAAAVAFGFFALVLPS